VIHLRRKFRGDANNSLIIATERSMGSKLVGLTDVLALS